MIYQETLGSKRFKIVFTEMIFKNRGNRVKFRILRTTDILQFQISFKITVNAEIMKLYKATSYILS